MLDRLGGLPGFRQFSLRSLDKVKGGWALATMTWNLKRMFALRPG